MHPQGLPGLMKTKKSSDAVHRGSFYYAVFLRRPHQKPRENRIARNTRDSAVAMVVSVCAQVPPEKGMTMRMAQCSAGVIAQVELPDVQEKAQRISPLGGGQGGGERIAGASAPVPQPKTEHRGQRCLEVKGCGKSPAGAGEGPGYQEICKIPDETGYQSQERYEPKRHGTRPLSKKRAAASAAAQKPYSMEII